jgi:hypothetical protein
LIKKRIAVDRALLELRTIELRDVWVKVFNQGWMRFARPILIAMLGFAFAAYGFDCSPMISPDQAMECCDSMDCSHGMQGEDCCQTGTSVHAPFVQPASLHSVVFPPLALATLPVSAHFDLTDHSDGRSALRFHDPPLFFDSTPSLQLRI